MHIGFLIFLCKTLGFWLFFYKHWNYDLILPNFRILAFFIRIRIFTSSFLTLEFWSYRFRDWNSYLIRLNIVSLSLLLYTLKFSPLSINLGILILSFPCNHCYSFLIFILSNIGIVFLSYTSYPSKHWNSGPIFIHIGILILSFHWKYLNFGPIFINIGIFVLPF